MSDNYEPLSRSDNGEMHPPQKMWIVSGNFNHLLKTTDTRKDVRIEMVVMDTNRQYAIQRMVDSVVKSYTGVVWLNTYALECVPGIYLVGAHSA